MKNIRTLLAATCALALAACATTQSGAGDTDSASDAALNKNPYPSTYRAYPGAPTALVGATVFDGKGGRLDNGTVLFADGKVVGVGGPDLVVPAAYVRIDGTGKFVTPGII